MPFFSLSRALFAPLSWGLLAAAAYLLWTGWTGAPAVAPDGEIVRVRSEWRLWTGGGLLAWSLLGRLPVLWFTTRGDHAPTRPLRGNGRMIDGVAGSQVYVEAQGEGRPIILTHGWGMDSTIWRCARLELSRHLRVITWDLPGLGLSRLPPRSGPSLELFAEELRGLAEAEGRPVVLVGHSIGGMIIQTLAKRRPDLFGRQVAGVVLLNTTYTDPSRTMALSGVVRSLRPLLKAGLRATVLLQPLAWLSAWQSYLSGSAHLATRLGFGAQATRSQLEHTTLLATRNPPGVQALGILAMLDWDADGALAGIDCPVLVVGGDIDLVTKPEAGDHIAATARRASLTRVAGANHMGVLEQADVYHAEIVRFIQTLPNPAGPKSLAALHKTFPQEDG